jgi:phosphomannomutase
MKAITSLKISISGVRGIVGESLTPILINNFAQSFATYLNSGLIVVGRDTRTSGEMVKKATLAGLLSGGCWVVDLDIVPVPTIQLMVTELKADGGIAITASHNPVEWNALKFIRSDGIFLNSYQAEELLDIYHQGDFKKVENHKIKDVKRETQAIQTHIKKILKLVDVDLIRKRKFKVAIDTCNGAGSLATPLLLKELGCEIVGINLEPTGIFQHPPEPIPENLKSLSKLVKNSDVDIGFAQDADADRLAIVNEKGEPIGEEYTLVLVVDFILSLKRGIVVTNLSTTAAIDDVAKKYDCPVIRTKVGEVNIAERMKKEKAVIGGEGTGGIIFPQLHFGRDSLAGIALVLWSLATKKIKISQLVESYPQYKIVKEKILVDSTKIPNVMKLLKEEYKKENLDLTEGIKIIRDNLWIHIRPSNTEPVIRIISEGKTEKEAKNTAREIIEKIKYFLKKGE